jgi:hypothetical protein
MIQQKGECGMWRDVNVSKWLFCGIQSGKKEMVHGRKKMLYDYPRLLHPFKDKPIKNKWIRPLTTHLFNQGWYEA